MSMRSTGAAAAFVLTAILASPAAPASIHVPRSVAVSAVCVEKTPSRGLDRGADPSAYHEQGMVDPACLPAQDRRRQ